MSHSHTSNHHTAIGGALAVVNAASVAMVAVRRGNRLVEQAVAA